MKKAKEVSELFIAWMMSQVGGSDENNADQEEQFDFENRDADLDALNAYFLGIPGTHYYINAGVKDNFDLKATWEFFSQREPPRLAAYEEAYDCEETPEEKQRFAKAENDKWWAEKTNGWLGDKHEDAQGRKIGTEEAQHMENLGNQEGVEAANLNKGTLSKISGGIDTVASWGGSMWAMR